MAVESIALWKQDENDEGLVVQLKQTITTITLITLTPSMYLAN